MFVAMLVEREREHVWPRGVSHSPVAFEEDLKQFVSQRSEISEEIYLE
jgi:hypothetical protein